MSSAAEVVRAIARRNLTRSSLILFLLISSFLVGIRPVNSQSQFCGAANGDLYELPACAVDIERTNPTTGQHILADNAYLTSITPQTILAQPGENLSFTITYQIWQSTVGNKSFCAYGPPCPSPSVLSFVGSWKPRSLNDYYLVYVGIPPPDLPGIKASASFHLTAPIQTGTYYLWLVLSYPYPGGGDVSFPFGTTYSLAEVVHLMKPPAHIKIIVSTQVSTKTVTAMIPGLVIQSPLTVPVLAIGVIGVAVALTSILVTRRKRARSIMEASFASLDELLLKVDQEVGKQNRAFATVMFTDIVGSTEWAAKLGDHKWHDLLNRHFALIRKELERFQGREVGTTGDGMLAVFADPERAVRCACSIRDAVRSLGLELHLGLHTGEVQFAGKNVAGIAVHIGARVASQAGPGEVLVSSTVRDLLAGSGIQFKDHGTRVLKGVPGRWHLFEVTAT